jgi:hypothetical protein
MTFTLEARDFQQVLHLHSLRSTGNRMKELGVAGLLILSVLAYWLLTDQPHKLPVYLLSAIVLVPMMIYSALAFAVRRAGRRAAAQGVTGLPITWRFAEDHVEGSSGATQASSTWDKWIGFVEVGDYFLLFLTPAVFNILPKRGLKTAEEVLELRKLLQSKLQIARNK